MREESGSQDFETRLSQIWEQGHRSMAAAFLRRAVTLDSTLAEVAAALQFDAVRNFRETLRLRDVIRELQHGGDAATPASTSAAAGPVAVEQLASSSAPRMEAPRRRRKRRGPDQLREIKAHIAKMLDDEPGSLDTTQMFDALGEAGYDLDRLTLNRLLAQLEEENRATCLGGRPKAWRSDKKTGEVEE